MTVDPESEPLFRRQWYLDNTGQTGGTPGVDINARPAWKLASGEGVTIAVNDTGVSQNFRNLDAGVGGNFFPRSTTSGVGPDPAFKAPWHGTAVASLAAADDRGAGLIGAAPDATLASLVGLGSTGALKRYDKFDVVNASWGFQRLFGDDFSQPRFQEKAAALHDAVANGRDGLGTALVFAAGNDFTDRGLFGFQQTGVGDANYHNFQNSRFTLPVAALDDNGTFSAPGNPAGFTTPGAPVLVSAPGTQVVTADLTGRLGADPGTTTVTQGTSFAAPLVSGVVALMLDANPQLGWRDIKEILAYTARQNDPGRESWQVNAADNWNGGGMHTNPSYGFGLVDAGAAVRLAESWRETDTSANEATVSATNKQPVAIAASLPTIEQTVTLPEGVDLETVAVDVNLVHAKFGDVTMTLTSPGGTTSALVRQPDAGGFAGFDRNSYRLTSNEFHGESSGGTWTLRIADASSDFIRESDGRLNAWKLTGYGSPAGDDDTYVYTDEYGAIASAAPSRQTLTDPRGTDTLNAAAVSDPVTIDLAPGATSVIASQPVKIGTATQIEDAFGGAGGDQLTGNAVDNLLDGGPGDDELTGGAGDDTLAGGRGADTLTGGAGRDTVRLDAARDAVTVARGTDGAVTATVEGVTDTLSGVEAVSFTDTVGVGVDALLSGSSGGGGESGSADANPPPSTTPNVVVLGGKAQALRVPFTADVRTTGETETVRVASGATVEVAAGDGDGVRLPAPLASYSVTAAGNRLILGDGATEARVALNGRVEIGFSDGVAAAEIVTGAGNPQIRLGGEPVGTGFDPGAVNLQSGTPGAAASGARADGNIVVANGESQTFAVPFRADVRGTGAAETVQVPASGDVRLGAGDGDEVEFARAFNAYSLSAAGNVLTVTRDGGARAEIALNGEVQLEFADGSAAAAIVTNAAGPAVTVDGEVVDAGFSPDDVSLDSADSSALAETQAEADSPGRETSTPELLDTTSPAQTLGGDAFGLA